MLINSVLTLNSFKTSVDFEAADSFGIVIKWTQNAVHKRYTKCQGFVHGQIQRYTRQVNVQFISCKLSWIVDQLLQGSTRQNLGNDANRATEILNWVKLVLRPFVDYDVWLDAAGLPSFANQVFTCSHWWTWMRLERKAALYLFLTKMINFMDNNFGQDEVKTQMSKIWLFLSTRCWLSCH